MYKLLFISPRPFYPDSSGGGQHSALSLFSNLRKLGWEVEIICSVSSIRSPSFKSALWQSLRDLQISFPVLRDKNLGFPCWRVVSKFANKHQWLKFLDQRLKDYQPNVVIGHCHPQDSLLNYANQKGYPTFYFARSADHFDSGARIPDGIHVIANSQYTASVIVEAGGSKPEVIFPFVEQDHYRVRERQRKYITFINPIPQKGVNIAIEVARQMPEKKFLFVKGKWVAYRGKEEDFLRSVYSLPNVEVWEHQEDMRQVYAVTDILLVPSQFKETFGRVILEAQLNSIPVVAAKVGGIPYTLGQGGILVEPKDKPRFYIEKLQQLCSDDNFYKKLSKLSFENSQRSEFNNQYQVKKFVNLVEKVIQTS